MVEWPDVIQSSLSSGYRSVSGQYKWRSKYFEITGDYQIVIPCSTHITYHAVC